MSDADPNAIEDALEAAVDAFNEEGHGFPVREDGIDTDADWKTQFTKGCRLLRIVDELEGSGYYVAVVELCFASIERSLEAFAIAEGGDELRDFQTNSHDYCYDRAASFGLFSRELARDLKTLYANNRTDSYYGGRIPTERQASTIRTLAREIHDHARNQLRESGVCNCG